MTIFNGYPKVLLVIVLSCSSICQALDEESAKERRCFEVPTTKELDYKWMQSVSKWYFPIWSKLDLYRTACDMTEVPMSSIPESQLDEACAVGDAENQFLFDGFNRTNVKFKYLTFREDGAIEFMSNSKFAKSGIHYLTHTNNQDYVVGVTCWEDDEASFAVWTPKPEISLENKQVILDHLEEIGFDKKFIVETPYDKCPTVSPKTSAEKEEL